MIWLAWGVGSGGDQEIASANPSRCWVITKLFTALAVPTTMTRMLSSLGADGTTKAGVSELDINEVW